MFSAKVQWVDDQRAQLKAANPALSWENIDNQIVDIAKTTLKGKNTQSSARALGLVMDYINQNPLGKYTIGQSKQKVAPKQAALNAFVNTAFSNGYTPQQVLDEIDTDKNPGAIITEAFRQAGYEYKPGGWFGSATFTSLDEQQP